MKNTIKYVIESLMALCLLGVVGYGISKYVEKPSIILTNVNTIEHIHRDSKKIPDFVGIIVIHADIQTNTRQLSYMYITDPDVKRLYDDYFSTRIINDKRSLFVRDDDMLNQRLVRLINHEFNCDPYNKTNGFTFAPSPNVVSVCSVAVPVSGVEFNGYVSVLLSKQPTEDNRALIEMIIRDIADDVSSPVRNH
jgi:hypothetical protein